MRFNDDKEVIVVLERLKGSIENRIREAYNKGYKAGFKEGAAQSTQNLVYKILAEVKSYQDEPYTEIKLIFPCKECPQKERCSAENWRSCFYDYYGERKESK